MRAARHRSWHESWRTVRGVARSLRTYYGISADRAAMDRLYGQFVQAGDLVFDIGAHVGGRTAAFRRLGARVVAGWRSNRSPLAGMREWLSSTSISTIRRFQPPQTRSARQRMVRRAGKDKHGPPPSGFR